MDKRIITPKTRIYDLLKAYPELEETLIGSAPEFKKLRNPVLRKTIARITNISQAAIIGGLNVEELVNRLRSKVGQGNIEKFEDSGTKFNITCPEWFSSKNIANSIDIREMLNLGEQPVHEVLATVKNLKDDQILEVIAPFIPAPLIDKSLSLGYKHWLKKKSETEFRVYFAK